MKYWRSCITEGWQLPSDFYWCWRRLFLTYLY